VYAYRPLNRDNAVSLAVVTRLRLDDCRIGVRFPAVAQTFQLSIELNLLLSNGYRERQTDRSLPSSVRLGMLGALSPLPHTSPKGGAWKQLCFNLYELLLVKQRGDIHTEVFWVMTPSSLAVAGHGSRAI
jgi:hypothetical protein